MRLRVFFLMSINKMKVSQLNGRKRKQIKVWGNILIYSFIQKQM